MGTLLQRQFGAAQAGHQRARAAALFACWCPAPVRGLTQARASASVWSSPGPMPRPHTRSGCTRAAPTGHPERCGH